MMALNKLMHPKNPYRDRKPNFTELAGKYEQFRKHAFEDERGGYHIDFKNPESLRALTWALLKEDYGLDVLLPHDRLVPTIPLRINYILWLEDILNKTEDVRVIDIGAGASCVYGLLGAKKNSWTFLSTEADATNFEYAKKNVMDNNLSDKISVVKVSEATILYDVLSDNDATYDFCMCNPPFFGSNFEAWGMLTTRSDDRPEPGSVNTASPAESIVPGGEVDFVKRMVSDSVVLKDRIRVYTTMLGKKSSLSVLREDLKRNGITNFGQTEFCQGKTMRWGLGWSFDDSVTFPKPPTKVLRAEKPKPPLVYPVPRGASPNANKYSVAAISDKITSLLQQLEILYNCTKCTKKEKQFDLVAVKNTWANQRRKRRQQQTQKESVSLNTEQQTQKLNTEQQTQKLNPEQQTQNETAALNTKQQTQKDAASLNTEQLEQAPNDAVSPNTKQAEICHDSAEINRESTVEHITTGDTPDICSDDAEQNSSPKRKIVDQEIQTNENDSVIKKQKLEITAKSNEDANTSNHGNMDVTDFLFKSTVSVKQPDSSGDVVLEMQWVEGHNRELMHQVLQYFKNKL